MSDRGIVVTGGSRGLGLELVKHRLNKGDRVATFARSISDELDELRSKHRENLLAQPVDMLDQEQVSAFFEEAYGRFGIMSCLVNNAAIGQDSMLVHTAPREIGRIVEADLISPILITRTFIRKILPTGGTARIVMIGSVVSAQGSAGLTVYAAAKAGLEGFTFSLARELRGRIAVNVLAPGFFSSEMSSVLDGRRLDAIAARSGGTLRQPSSLLPMIDELLESPIEKTGEVLRPTDSA